MGADLHLHTTASDGSVSAAQLVDISSKVGLEAIAITDHDTFAGIDQALKTAEGLEIEVIPGIELSAFVDDKDIHLLAFWPDYKAQWLNKELAVLREARIKRASLMIKKLNKNHFSITLEDVFNIAGDASIGRMHIAKLLIERGYVKSIKHAFEEFIGPNGCCYIQKPTKTPEEVLSMIKKANGVAVLAHPGIADSDELIPSMIDQGLAGIEAGHPDHSVEQIKYYEEMALHYNLVVTAGSDFHSQDSSKGAIPGTYRATMSAVEELRKRLSKLKIKNEK